MFERCTEASRQIFVVAQARARALGHDRIDLVHVLLGMLADPVVAPTLEARGVTTEWLCAAGPQANQATPTTAQISCTSPARKVLDLALREALSLGSNYIEPLHVLLGADRFATDDAYARELMRLEEDLGGLRAEVMRQLLTAARPDRVPVSSPSSQPPTNRAANRAHIAELKAALGTDPDRLLAALIDGREHERKAHEKAEAAKRLADALRLCLRAIGGDGAVNTAYLLAETHPSADHEKRLAAVRDLMARPRGGDTVTIRGRTTR